MVLVLAMAWIAPGLACAQPSLQPNSLYAHASRAAAQAALARDLDRVESVRAVKRLQYALAQYVEAGAWARAAGLFTDDARWIDGGQTIDGPRGIQAHLQASLGPAGDAAHALHLLIFMAPIVTLSADGQSAKARWHGVSMSGALHDSADWAGGIYENDYVRRGGVWKIARQAYSPYLVGPYRTGWRSAAAETPLVPYQFQAAALGRPAVLGDMTPAGPSAARPNLAALDARASALKDEGAVRNLQNAYGYYIDRRMWDDAAELFDSQGGLSIAGVGSYDGPAGVRRALERDGPAGLRYGEMNDHIQADPVIEVSPDGIHARARGIDLGMLGRNEGAAFWTVTDVDNLYVKRDGVWRIDRMRLSLRLKTNYFEGWAKSWLAETPPPPAAAPDRADAAMLPAPWDFETGAAPQPAAHPRSVGAIGADLWAAAAYDAAEDLAGAYGQLLDDNQWEDLASIFATNGERDSAGGGFIRGPARIGAFSRARYGPYNPHRTGANMHMRTQPVVDIAADGRTGQERTRLFQMIVGQADAPPAKYHTGMLMTGSYEDDLVFENGAWKYKRVDLDHLVYTLDYEHGWTRIPEGTGKLLDPPLGSVSAADFDAPGLGDMYPPFPKVGHMWLHYKNPVSGRAPAYLMPKYPLPEP